METEQIKVEVVFAYPDRFFLKQLTLSPATTVQSAIVQSGVLEKYTEIDLRKNKIGIFSRPAKLNDVLENGDRVEIYRELIADPKEIRRKRAEQQKNNS